MNTSFVPTPGFTQQMVNTIRAEIRRQMGGSSNPTSQGKAKTPYIRYGGYLLEDLEASLNASDPYSLLPNSMVTVYRTLSDGSMQATGSIADVYNRYTDRQACEGQFIEFEFRGGKMMAVELCCDTECESEGGGRV
jgi:hypothetical protein|tara:strand:- start:5760 stop:6167 length:408 start_codon:yes stop_codon:yes gene_type:complete